MFVDGCQGEPPCEECDCGCGDGCNGCIENADRKNDDLIDRADQQFNDVEAIENPAMGSDPFSSECEVVLPDDFSLRPYFYLHWGKSAGDRIENHDTEVLYITVKNIFEDLEFRGFKVASLGFDPSPSLRDHARIVPDCFVDYGCIPPCSSITREFALITRNRGEYIGPVHLTLDYCYDDLVVSDPRAIGGTASFELEIIDDD